MSLQGIPLMQGSWNGHRHSNNKSTVLLLKLPYCQRCGDAISLRGAQKLDRNEDKIDIIATGTRSDTSFVCDAGILIHLNKQKKKKTLTLKANTLYACHYHTCLSLILHLRVRKQTPKFPMSNRKQKQESLVGWAGWKSTENPECHKTKNYTAAHTCYKVFYDIVHGTKIELR